MVGVDVGGTQPEPGVWQLFGHPRRDGRQRHRARPGLAVRRLQFVASGSTFDFMALPTFGGFVQWSLAGRIHRMSAAMLSATRAAASCMESRARCAYRAVVSTWAWPSNLPIMGRLSPSARAREAKL